MGRAQAEGMAEAVRLGWIQEEIALLTHLRCNHYPPLPSALAGACQAAIEALRDEEPDREIEMPDGILWRGQPTATAAQVAESAHLWEFV